MIQLFQNPFEAQDKLTQASYLMNVQNCRLNCQTLVVSTECVEYKKALKGVRA